MFRAAVDDMVAILNGGLNVLADLYKFRYVALTEFQKIIQPLFGSSVDRRVEHPLPVYHEDESIY